MVSAGIRWGEKKDKAYQRGKEHWKSVKGLNKKVDTNHLLIIHYKQTKNTCCILMYEIIITQNFQTTITTNTTIPDSRKTYWNN